MFIPYYYKSSNTLTNQGTHNLPLSSTLELWEILTWPSEGIWLAPHRCSLLGLLFFVLRRCHWIACLPCTSLVIFQASSKTFDLFDEVILMAEGKIVYHGPRTHVLQFFEDCGFRCPKRKVAADFLHEVREHTSFSQIEIVWFLVLANSIWIVSNVFVMTQGKVLTTFALYPKGLV